MNPKNKTKKIYSQINYWLGVVAIGLIVGLSIQFAVAWTEPTEVPPAGNLGAPLNVSKTLQSKEAGLLINKGWDGGAYSSIGLAVPNGKVVLLGNTGIGTSATTSDKLTVNGKVNVKGNKIVGVGWPTEGQDAVNLDYLKDYVEANSGGGGYVVVAENSNASYTSTHHSTLVSFINKGGILAGVQCKISSTYPSTTYWAPIIDVKSTNQVIFMAPVVQNLVYCLANSKCYRNVGEGILNCDNGWKIIGVEF